MVTNSNRPVSGAGSSDAGAGWEGSSRLENSRLSGCRGSRLGGSRIAGCRGRGYRLGRRRMPVRFWLGSRCHFVVFLPAVTVRVATGKRRDREANGSTDSARKGTESERPAYSAAFGPDGRSKGESNNAPDQGMTSVGGAHPWTAFVRSWIPRRLPPPHWRSRRPPGNLR